MLEYLECQYDVIRYTSQYLRKQTFPNAASAIFNLFHSNFMRTLVANAKHWLLLSYAISQNMYIGQIYVLSFSQGDWIQTCHSNLVFSDKSSSRR